MTDQTLTDLTRVKALFQARTLGMLLGQGSPRYNNVSEVSTCNLKKIYAGGTLKIRENHCNLEVTVKSPAIGEA